MIGGPGDQKKIQTDDLRCLCDVLTRAQTVLAVLTASRKPLVSFCALVRLEAMLEQRWCLEMNDMVVH